MRITSFIMKILNGIILVALFSSTVFSQNSKRWSLSKDGGIYWTVKDSRPHTDHIEMSGLQVSAIIDYGVSETGTLQLKKKIVFPMLRTIPNDTRGSLIVDFNTDNQIHILVNDTALLEYPKGFSLKGKLVVSSSTNSTITVMRTLFPSVDKPALIEILTLKNNGAQPCRIKINDYEKPFETDSSKTVYGKYIVTAAANDTLQHTLNPGDEFTCSVIYSGRKETDEKYFYSSEFELNKRDKFIKELFENLVLETPNDTINREFAFAKIRTTESIYDTKGGLMHGPGGGAYYAAIWANDQAEYADPFFPFLGNIYGNESAINSFRQFAHYINSEYKPIPSSIVAEGVDFWNGAGDRGDQAMIAYGASRFALAYGKKETAKKLWPLITWCIEYLERQKTSDGVIKSDNDELEGRFPAGKINLSTNCLAYGAYISAAFLGDELGFSDVASSYRAKARSLNDAIEKYFGANVQSYKTYRYYSENNKLRSWICLPLVMGITKRKEETIRALFSKYLWTSNGILTESGDTTFWDRSTLYAFRGLFVSGATDECMKYFSYYSATRLLGEHVPYPVEAWPEGGQRHLAAESALYCRTVIEGLFDMEPTGLNKFKITPRLPKGWNEMKLKNVHAFDNSFDIDVKRSGSEAIVTVKISNGSIIIIRRWNKKDPILFELPLINR